MCPRFFLTPVRPVNARDAHCHLELEVVAEAGDASPSVRRPEVRPPTPSEFEQDCRRFFLLFRHHGLCMCPPSAVELCHLREESRKEAETGPDLRVSFFHKPASVKFQAAQRSSSVWPPRRAHCSPSLLPCRAPVHCHLELEVVAEAGDAS